VRLAEEVRRQALRVLELDSLHAGAHHVLGQWHAEVRRLSGVSRFFARHVLGAEVLDQASWDQAVRHLERAVELAPQGIIHHLELARVYLDRDREADARDELREVLQRPALEPTDPLHKQEAVRLMGELD
jgi:Tfp pilus assembly protein PilF